MCYCVLIYDDNHILFMFYIKMSCIIVSLTNSGTEISWYFHDKFSEQSTNDVKFDFQYLSTATFKVTQLLSPKNIKHQTTEKY